MRTSTGPSFVRTSSPGKIDNMAYYNEEGATLQQPNQGDYLNQSVSMIFGALPPPMFSV